MAEDGAGSLYMLSIHGFFFNILFLLILFNSLNLEDKIKIKKKIKMLMMTFKT